jgi:hypothetical protein
MPVSLDPCYLIQEQFGGSSPQLVFGLATGGEGRRKGTCKLNIVIAYQRYLIGNSYPALEQAAHEAEREQVVGTEGCRRLALVAQQRPDALLARTGILGRSGDLDHHLPGIKTRCFDRPAHALASLGTLANAERTTHESDTAMPKFQEVARGKFPSSHIVDRDGTEAVQPARPVEKHNCHLLLAQALEIAHLISDRRNQDPRSSLLFEDPQIATLFLRRIVGIAENHHIARLVRRIFDTTRHLGEKGVGHIEHDQPEVAAPPGSQLMRRGIAYKAEFLDHNLHTLARCLGNHFWVIEDIGDRAQRDSSSLGNFTNTHHACCSFRSLTRESWIFYTS